MGFGFTPFLVFAFLTKLSSNVVVIVLRGILCRQFQKFMTTIEFNLWIIIVWMNYFSSQPAESCNHHPQKEYAKIISQQLALYTTCNLAKTIINSPPPARQIKNKKQKKDGKLLCFHALKISVACHKVKNNQPLCWSGFTSSLHVEHLFSSR